MNKSIPKAPKSQKASPVTRSACKIQTLRRPTEASRNVAKNANSHLQDAKKEEIKSRAERILPQYPHLGRASAWPIERQITGEDRERKISSTHLCNYFGRTREEIHSFLKSDQVVMSLESVDRLKRHFNRTMVPTSTVLKNIDEFFAGDADDKAKQYVQMYCKVLERMVDRNVFIQRNPRTGTRIVSVQRKIAIAHRVLLAARQFHAKQAKPKTHESELGETSRVRRRLSRRLVVESDEDHDSSSECTSSDAPADTMDIDDPEDNDNDEHEDSDDRDDQVMNTYAEHNVNWDDKSIALFEELFGSTPPPGSLDQIPTPVVKFEVIWQNPYPEYQRWPNAITQRGKTELLNGKPYRFVNLVNWIGNTFDYDYNIDTFRIPLEVNLPDSSTSENGGNLIREEMDENNFDWMLEQFGESQKPMIVYFKTIPLTEEELRHNKIENTYYNGKFLDVMDQDETASRSSRIVRSE